MSKAMRTVATSRIGLAVMVAVTTAVVVGGVSAASIPDGSGAIHGCYKASGTTSPLSLLNTAVHPKCPSGLKSLVWDASPPGIGVATGGATPAVGSGATCTLGEVSLFAEQGANLPKNYVVAKGQVLTISSNTALFSLILTAYGGNGVSTFALPNVQSLAPNHMTYGICVAGIYP